jgi:hypothetical protein
MGPRKRWPWTKVLKALKQFKKDTDHWDTQRAKEEYADPEVYAVHFSYRKGTKLMLFKNEVHIARKFRKLEGNPRFWDYEEEEDCEEED